MRKSFIFLAGLARVGLAPTVNAQCVECAMQMYQATLTSNVIQSSNEIRNNDDYRRDAHNGICYDRNWNYPGCSDRSSSSSSPSIGTQTENAVMAVLNSEYRRRVQTYGSDNAAQWLNKASGDVGRQVAGLLDEYGRRSTTGNTTSANNWLIDNARQTAERYVSNNTGASLGDATTVGVPATTRKLAEDATFAVLEPEINRRSKAYGRAKTVDWARSMGFAVGAGVRNLAPEYAIRAKSDGAASADRWYVDQSRELAKRQIRSGQ